MYVKRDSKYFTYLYLIDLASIAFSFFLSELIGFNGFSNIPRSYGILLTLALLANCCSANFCKSYTGFFNRGKFIELKSVLKTLFVTVLITLGCLFIFKNSSYYSRKFIILFSIFSVIVTYLARLLFKNVIMKKYSATASASKLMIITTSDRIIDMYHHYHDQSCWDYSVCEIAIVDTDMTGEVIGKTPIAGNESNMFELARVNVVDEVLVNIGYHNPNLEVIVHEFQKMGITVHIVLNNLSFDMPNPRVEHFSSYNVLTTCSNEISHRQLMCKRIIDICGAIVGLIITGIVSIFVVPAIKRESKGPAFYSQIRVGRNGRKFKFYKFRSMYLDADERKAKLMEQNKMEGLMFKIDDDPRITKVGKFIRKTSIDELPQFWNVLKGDMSLVGTRPPTMEEFEKYDSHHKNRLSFKPGITGMWQVSGRSNITDFEDIVKLDKQYIDDWSISLDIKILLMTVLSVLKRKGAE